MELHNRCYTRWYAVRDGSVQNTFTSNEARAANRRLLHVQIAELQGPSKSQFLPPCVHPELPAHHVVSWANAGQRTILGSGLTRSVRSRRPEVLSGATKNLAPLVHVHRRCTAGPSTSCTVSNEHHPVERLTLQLKAIAPAYAWLP